jgi:hypothetical protein
MCECEDRVLQLIAVAGTCSPATASTPAQPLQPWGTPCTHFVITDGVHPDLARGVGRNQPLPGIPASSTGRVQRIIGNGGGHVHSQPPAPAPGQDSSTTTAVDTPRSRGCRQNKGQQ